MTELRFDVAGAEGPKAFFSRLRKDTIAHGYLFSGPAGIGKKTFARRLAQSLLCEAQDDGVLGYDGTCASCRQVEAGTHPDFMESAGALKIGDRESSLGFHEGEEMTARDLVRQLSLQSYAGGFRVFVLGDVDFATHHAANALLKFFEEPPPSVILLLTTSTPGRLLATIRSRLVELQFQPLSGAQVQKILVDDGVSEDDAKLAATLGQGSVTRAREILSGDDESVRKTVIDWFFEVVGGDTPQETWVSRDTLDEGLETLKTLVRDWTALSLAGNAAPVLAADVSSKLKKLPAIAPEAATRALMRITDAQKIARTNVSPALVAEMVRMHLSSLAVN